MLCFTPCQLHQGFLCACTWPLIMAERPAKFAKIQSIRSRLPFVSQSALSALVKVAKEEGLSDVCNRHDVRRARDKTIKEVTQYGPLHNTTRVNDDFSLEFQHPVAILSHLCKVSGCFSKLIARTAAATPPSPATPWRIIFYCDEILPGNQLAYKNQRKFYGFYWSVLEFGGAALSDEDR